jgi:exopolyphosphatase/pppGpp-phosphohydrolase
LNEFLEEVRSETGIDIVVISQEREARIGFLETAARAGVSQDRLVVWDAGGGSMQVSYWDPQTDSVKAYLGSFAHDAMQRFLIVSLQKKVYTTTVSPNPILSPGDHQQLSNGLSQAIRKAEMEANANIPNGLLKRLGSHGTEVIGIGGIPYNCEFLHRLPGCSFTKDELEEQAHRYGHLTDRELVDAGLSAGLAFAPFRVSAAALTVGFMNTFGIQKMRTMKVDMGEGILLNPDFWQ